MKLFARLALATTASLILALGAAAQNTQPAASSQDTKTASSSGSEKTVEEAYLQESAETAMIKEFAAADDKDSKIIALAYAKRAIDGGRKNDEIRSSLQYLALENNYVVAKSAGLGRSTNNFPDVRADACKYLADFPSVESKNTLVQVLQGARTEDPMVLAEAVNSLGKIGMNDNDEVVDVIAQTINHFADLGISEDRFAVYCLFAIQNIADKNGGIKDMRTVTNAVMQFTKGAYVGSVKRMALATLDKLSQMQAKTASSGANGSNAASSSSSTKK